MLYLNVSSVASFGSEKPTLRTPISLPTLLFIRLFPSTAAVWIILIATTSPVPSCFPWTTLENAPSPKTLTISYESLGPSPFSVVSIPSSAGPSSSSFEARPLPFVVPGSIKTAPTRISLWASSLSLAASSCRCFLVLGRFGSDDGSGISAGRARVRGSRTKLGSLPTSLSPRLSSRSLNECGVLSPRSPLVGAEGKGL